MSDDPALQSPFNQIPPIVVALCLLMAGVELAFWAQSNGFIAREAVQSWRLVGVDRYGFFDQGFDRAVSLGAFDLDQVKRMVTYPFIHLSFTHMIFAVVLTLALGKMVGEVFGTMAVLIVWVASGMAGALAFGLILDEARPLLGGYPPVYGLIGAFTFLLWVNLAGTGQSHRAFSLIALLLGIQLVFGLLFGGTKDWVADVAGFATGFVLSFLVSPGGWRALLERLRDR